MIIELWQVALLFATGLVAGFVDSIAGGGGLITLPVLLSLGIDPKLALGTNKLQATFGSGSAAFLTQYDDSTRGFTVQRYDLQTGGLSYFAPGGTGYLAIVTVPEPSGVLMLATALGCLAGALRLRRR